MESLWSDSHANKIRDLVGTLSCQINRWGGGGRFKIIGGGEFLKILINGEFKINGGWVGFSEKFNKWGGVSK